MQARTMTMLRWMERDRWLSVSMRNDEAQKKPLHVGGCTGLIGRRPTTWARKMSLDST